MKSDKLKVLFAPSDLAGVGHIRSIWPAQLLKKYHSDEIEVRISTNPNTHDIEYLSQFDIIHFHRAFGAYEKTQELVAELNKRGTILVMDIDDYWNPPPTHHLHALVQADKMHEKIENNLRVTNYVTTTTDIFANEISKFNKNVFVIPNAVNMEENMWKSEVVENKSGKVRVAWIGGSSHLYDLHNLKDSMFYLANDKTLKGKFQVVMCGFDTRGTITEIQGNEKKIRAIKKHETIWMDFEKIFTADYKLLNDDPEYLKWLLKIENKPYPNQELTDYIRRWTLPLTQYAKHYDHCDICLAPIAESYANKSPKGQVSYKENMFNKMKSELKIIESGMKRKVLIAQDFGIYKEILKDGETGILIKDNKDGWYKAIKKLINDEVYRNELADNLHEFVKEKYLLTNVNKSRLDFYKNIVSSNVSIEQKNQEVAV